MATTRRHFRRSCVPPPPARHPLLLASRSPPPTPTYAPVRARLRTNGAPPPLLPVVPLSRSPARHGDLFPHAASAPCLTPHSEEAVDLQRDRRLRTRPYREKEPAVNADDGSIQHRNPRSSRLQLGDSWISTGPDRLYVHNEKFVRRGVHQG